MKAFLDEEFLLSNETAKTLYHEYAEAMPIVDYHCHINPKEIAENKSFETITQLWLLGDHYKWRLMRSCGVEERFITGDASAFEKFQMWAKSLERAIGNPLYHWSHLELKRYFGYQGVLNESTAKEVWDFCNKKIKDQKMDAHFFMKQSNVEIVGTTDDPTDDLVWHKEIAKRDGFFTKVVPTFRPDKAILIEQESYLEYLDKLSVCAGITIASYEDFCAALSNRMDYFAKAGCKSSDHGLSYIPYAKADEKTVEAIFQKRLRKEVLTQEEAAQFQTACLLFLGEAYAKQNWVMQLHVGVTRNNNSRMMKLVGPDTGFDGIYNKVPFEQLTAFLDALETKRFLPKTIIYSLNPGDNAAIQTLIGCFMDQTVRGKIQHGAAWWFNDHEMGMREQMTSLASQSVLSNFVGMLTDSRSFLSYTRHEYFRRILCDLLGTWVESGRYPADMKRLGLMVEDICGKNAKEYFEF